MGTWDYLKYWVRGRNQCWIVTSQHTLINSYQSNVKSLISPIFWNLRKTYTLQRFKPWHSCCMETMIPTATPPTCLGIITALDRARHYSFSFVILFFGTGWTHTPTNWQWELWTMYFKNNLLCLWEKEHNLNMRKSAFIKKRFDEHVYQLLLNLLKNTKKPLLDFLCVVSERKRVQNDPSKWSKKRKEKKRGRGC